MEVAGEAGEPGHSREGNGCHLSSSCGMLGLEEGWWGEEQVQVGEAERKSKEDQGGHSLGEGGL